MANQHTNKTIMLSEDDCGHIEVLLWRTTLEKIAEKIGVSHTTLSNARSGKKGLRLEVLEKLRALTRDDFPKEQKDRKPRRKGSLGFAERALVSRGKEPLLPYHRD